MDGEVAHHEPTEGGCSGTHSCSQHVFLPPLSLYIKMPLPLVASTL